MFKSFLKLGERLMGDSCYSIQKSRSYFTVLLCGFMSPVRLVFRYPADLSSSAARRLYG